MARGGVARSNMLLLLRRSAYKVGAERGFSKLLGSEGVANAKSSSNGGKVVEVDSSPSSNSCCWVPHPRTGIYFPVGHEWVMKDVPEDAATFADTCWFRNVDATTVVDNHNPNQDAPYRPPCINFGEEIELVN